MCHFCQLINDMNSLKPWSFPLILCFIIHCPIFQDLSHFVTKQSEITKPSQFWITGNNWRVKALKCVSFPAGESSVKADCWDPILTIRILQCSLLKTRRIITVTNSAGKSESQSQVFFDQLYLAPSLVVSFAGVVGRLIPSRLSFSAELFSSIFKISRYFGFFLDFQASVLDYRSEIPLASHRLLYNILPFANVLVVNCGTSSFLNSFSVLMFYLVLLD